MDSKYLVTTRSGGTAYYIFESKTEAIEKLNNSNKYGFNAVMCEYIEIDGYIISKQLDENITPASCGCILCTDFSFIQKISLSEAKNYFNGISQKVIFEQNNDALPF